MIDKEVFLGHLRLMSPIELCTSIEKEELLRNFCNLELNDKVKFSNELQDELVNIIKLFLEIQTKIITSESLKDYDNQLREVIGQ